MSDWGKHIQKSSQMPFGVSVIIPSFQSESHLRPLLDSLRHQTLPPHQFEILLLINGSDYGAANIADSFHDLPIVIHFYKVASVSFARNQGIKHATFRFLTFIDADDTVSPTYLESLLSNSSLLGISIAHLSDVTPDGTVHDSPIEKDIRLVQSQGRPTYETALSQLHRVLTMTTCKLVPTTIAQLAAFKHHLKSGEDVVYFSTLFSLWQPEIRITPKNATYFRTVRPFSVSRQPLSFKFNVKERVDVLQELYHLLSPTQAALNTMLRKKINAQWHFIFRYADQYPFDKSIILRETARLYVPPSEIENYHVQITMLLAIDFDSE